ncbi:hypothetical protein [Domibacillus indicus]|uniref:hypothetical protein n=1 Tax=Domibacillus indicus TaxID=1437523 RepID=UPI0006182245|nr:hypothetical protein [Domibacillus indicus]
MNLYNLKIWNAEKPDSLPTWIKLAFTLGAYLVKANTEKGKRVNIAITVPRDEYFSLFAAMGITDGIYSSNDNNDSLRDHVLKLKKGDRIIYKNGDLERKVSVVSVGKSPMDKTEMMLYIQDRNFHQGIPERQWQQRIFLLNEKYEKIKRTRVLGESEKIGVDSPLLSLLYTTEKLNKTAFSPIEAFYLVGKKNQLISQMNETIFCSGEVKGSISNFLFVEGLNNNSSYSNGKFMSSLTRKAEDNLSSNTPVLYSDATSFKKQERNFKKNPFLSIISRSDHEDRLHEVTFEITKSIIQGRNIDYLTENLVDFINNECDCIIPDGVELIAWREGIG